MTRGKPRNDHVEIVIQAHGNQGAYWREIWRYRELIYFLCWRDVLVRYKQTAIGVMWAVLRPVLTIVVFSSFGALFHIDTHGSERLLLVSAGTLPWMLFSSGLQEASMSLVSNSNLLTKVYFPRLIVPLSAIFVCLVDFLIALLILAGLMIYYAKTPGMEVVFLPMFLILALFSTAGSGVLLSALTVKYRDFRYVVPFLIQLGFFVSPIGFSSADVYSSGRIPWWVKFIYSLNPMVAVIEGFRWSLLRDRFLAQWTVVGLSGVVALSLAFIGCWYFRKVEIQFADII